MSLDPLVLPPTAVPLTGWHSGDSKEDRSLDLLVLPPTAVPLTGWHSGDSKEDRSLNQLVLPPTSVPLTGWHSGDSKEDRSLDLLVLPPTAEPLTVRHSGNSKEDRSLDLLVLPPTAEPMIVRHFGDSKEDRSLDLLMLPPTPGGKIFVWPEFRITPIFTTHFCQILSEPWEILRIYMPSGYIHETDPWQAMWQTINLLLFSSQLTFFSLIFLIFYDVLFLDIPSFFTPPRKFFCPTL